MLAVHCDQNDSCEIPINAYAHLKLFCSHPPGYQRRILSNQKNQQNPRNGKYSSVLRLKFGYSLSDVLDEIQKKNYFNICRNFKYCVNGVV